MMIAYSDFILFFTFYSFLGWVMETVFASINEKKFINRGFLNGFFCPIYGFGAIIVVQSASWINAKVENYFEASIISILCSVVLITALEYITGSLLERIFNCKWWDYSNNAMNLKGYVCLKYSLLWGILTLLLIQVIHPLLLGLVVLFPPNIKVYISICLSLYFLADTVKSMIEALNLRDVILNYSKFTVHKYYEKIIQHKRIFIAFPRLLLLNAGIINRDVRSILNDKIDKIKVELKSRFQQL